jgi:hypothetical protein
MVKSAFVIAIAVAATAVLAPPALAAKHQRSCYDFAWESQDMKDCLANPDHMPMHKMRHTHMHHGMEHMKDMKDMKGMDDKDTHK